MSQMLRALWRFVLGVGVAAALVLLGLLVRSLGLSPRETRIVAFFLTCTMFVAVPVTVLYGTGKRERKIIAVISGVLGVVALVIGGVAEGSQPPISIPLYLAGAFLLLVACGGYFGASLGHGFNRQEVDRALRGDVMKQERTIRFYTESQTAHAAGALGAISVGYSTARSLTFEKFVRQQPPVAGSALHTFLTRFGPLPQEVLVAVGNLPDRIPVGWFVLTTLRLVQRDGATQEFKEVLLDDVESYALPRSGGGGQKPESDLAFTLKSGGRIEFRSVAAFPSEDYLKATLELRRRGGGQIAELLAAAAEPHPPAAPPDLETLCTGLRSSDAETRLRCASQLGDRGAAASSALRDLESLAKDEDSRVRMRAKWAVETIRDKSGS